MRRLAALALLLWPAEAWAHSPIRGVGTFYAGLLHPLLIPAQLLALLALGLWLAQQEPAGRRLAIAAFALALLAAVPLAPRLDWNAGGLPILLAALALALLAALRVRAATWPLLAAALLTAFALGLDSAADDPAAGAQLRFTLGVWLGATLVVLNLAVHAGRLTRHWQRLGLRVAGAWIAAAAAMVAALALVPQS